MIVLFYQIGDLLENYCWDDDLMNFARVLFSVSILLTFPIECFVSREVCSHSQYCVCTTHIGFFLITHFCWNLDCKESNSSISIVQPNWIRKGIRSNSRGWRRQWYLFKQNNTGHCFDRLFHITNDRMLGPSSWIECKNEIESILKRNILKNTIHITYIFFISPGTFGCNSAGLYFARSCLHSNGVAFIAQPREAAGCWFGGIWNDCYICRIGAFAAKSDRWL